jgi:hypothetical protein
MATVTPNFNWPVPTSTDLVKDGATAIEALGDAIDAGLVDLKGGTTGQVLAKASGTDLDFSWVAQDDSNAIQNTQLTAKGALISAFSAGTPATLTVGTNGQVLTADSTAATGLAWSTVGSDFARITKVTFSESSAINIDNCFSSTYDFYVIQAQLTASNAGVFLYGQMRVGGSNAATSYSNCNSYVQWGGAPGVDTNDNVTVGQLAYLRSTDQLTANMSIQNPFVAQYTSFWNNMPDPSYYQSFQSIHKTKTSYDGISFTPSAGTLTGELNIYGYKKG